jgi:hypothetical protein
VATQVANHQIRYVFTAHDELMALRQVIDSAGGSANVRVKVDRIGDGIMMGAWDGRRDERRRDVSAA